MRLALAILTLLLFAPTAAHAEWSGQTLSSAHTLRQRPLGDRVGRRRRARVVAVPGGPRQRRRVGTEGATRAPGATGVRRAGRGRAGDAGEPAADDRGRPRALRRERRAAGADHRAPDAAAGAARRALRLDERALREAADDPPHAGLPDRGRVARRQRARRRGAGLVRGPRRAHGPRLRGAAPRGPRVRRAPAAGDRPHPQRRGRGRRCPATCSWLGRARRSCGRASSRAHARRFRAAQTIRSQDAAGARAATPSSTPAAAPCSSGARSRLSEGGRAGPVFFQGPAPRRGHEPLPPRRAARDDGAEHTASAADRRRGRPTRRRRGCDRVARRRGRRVGRASGGRGASGARRSRPPAPTPCSATSPWARSGPRSRSGTAASRTRRASSGPRSPTASVQPFGAPEDGRRRPGATRASATRPSSAQRPVVVIAGRPAPAAASRWRRPT